MVPRTANTFSLWPLAFPLRFVFDFPISSASWFTELLLKLFLETQPVYLVCGKDRGWVQPLRPRLWDSNGWREVFRTTVTLVTVLAEEVWDPLNTFPLWVPAALVQQRDSFEAAHSNTSTCKCPPVITEKHWFQEISTFKQCSYIFLLFFWHYRGSSCNTLLWRLISPVTLTG